MSELFIGVYKVERKVSTSGQSIVYKAIDPRNGRPVAIKVTHSPADAEDHELVVARFRTESALLAAVRHASIPRFCEEGTLPDGSPYFVMEWVQGRTLEEVLKAEGRPSTSVALSIARQIAGALGAVHAIGYVHRDTKPGNIMVPDEGRPGRWTVKLLDFGVGGALLEHSQVTTANGLFGTVLYMSPEQLRGEGVSPRSDVWQLGLTLFEMLMGALPYQAGGTYAVMNAILNVPVTIPSVANLQPGVAEFLLRCLAKDPALRPADGNEAAAEIDRLLLALPPVPVETMPSAERNFAEGKVPAPSVASAALPAPPWTAVTIAPSAASRSSPNAPVARGAGPKLELGWGVLIGLCVLLAAFMVFLLVHPPVSLSPLPPAQAPARSPGGRTWNPWSGVALGMALAFGGTMLGKVVRRVMAAKFNAISREAQMVLSGERGREQLSRKLALQVDDIVAKCRMVDEKFMAMTLAVMVDEYGASTTSDERQKALMNAVALLEKLMVKLSPWYVRHDKLIALMVTLVGVLSGLATVAQSAAKLIKGS